MDVGPLTGQMVDLLIEEADREVVGLGGDVLRQTDEGRAAAGSSIVCTAGSDDTTCSGFMMRSQYRLTERNASLTVVDGSPKCSTCCSTGSGRRLAKVSPAINSNGMRLSAPLRRR